MKFMDVVNARSTIGHLHLNRRRFYHLTNTSSATVLDPASVQQVVVVVVVEQPEVVVVVRKCYQVESDVQRCRHHCPSLHKQ